MGIFDSLFDKKSSPKVPDGRAQETPNSLAVVFDKPNSYDASSLQRTLRGMSSDLQSAVVESWATSAKMGTPVNRVSWGSHVIDITGFDVPFPKAHLENCVQAAHYGKGVKARVRAQQSHALLFYSGEESKPLERYIALAAVASAFSKHGGSAVLNESAMTSLPADTVYQLATAKSDFDVLRHTPLLMLFCGFVKYFLPDGKTVWMRTYNNPAFGLPDLAAEGRADEAESTFQIFSDLMSYLLNSGAKFAPGHTAQIGKTSL